MRTDWQHTPRRDGKRDVSVLIYSRTSWAELLSGRRIALPWNERRPYVTGDLALTPSTLVPRVALQDHLNSEPPSAYWAPAVEADYTLETPFDLSPYLTSASHNSQELRLAYTYDGVLPGTGALVQILDNITSQTLWVGMLESFDSRFHARGSRTQTLTARSRDASPLWRRIAWSTDVYPVATELSVIVSDVVTALGLDPAEAPTVQPYARWTPHTSTQLGDMTAWDMLSVTLWPVMLEPWVDAMGRFKPVSRDVRRPADLELTAPSVVQITGSKSSLPPTAIVLRWLDQNLSKSLQQEQVLATESLTAGFFKLRERRRVYWSKDRHQRAQDTRMVILESVNDALLPNVGDESYEELDPFSGRITVETKAWVPTLATVLLAYLLVAAAIPDLVTVGGIIVSEGVTISVGRLVHAAAEIVLLLIMMSLGTGQYEIWGRPYDYVHARNTTEAFRADIRQWERVETIIENDFVTDEEHAQALATNELLYQHLGANTQTAQVADDPRIERGDIVLLPDDTRFFVLDYSRDLMRGAPEILQLQGFRA